MYMEMERAPLAVGSTWMATYDVHPTPSNHTYVLFPLMTCYHLVYQCAMGRFLSNLWVQEDFSNSKLKVSLILIILWKFSIGWNFICIVNHVKYMYIQILRKIISVCVTTVRLLPLIFSSNNNFPCMHFYVRCWSPLVSLNLFRLIITRRLIPHLVVILCPLRRCFSWQWSTTPSVS